MLNALAEENRFKIVELLMHSDHTVNEISDILQIRQPQVSKHLKVLNEANIVHVDPIKQKRIYSLSIESFKELEDWSVTIRKTWNNRLDRLDEYIEEYNKKRRENGKNDESRPKK